MKKFWMIFLAMVVCLSLVACGGNEEVDSDSDGQLVSDADVQETANSESESKNDGSNNSSPPVEAPEENQTTDVENAPSDSVDLNDYSVVGENTPDDSSAETDSEQYITEELTNPEQEALIASVAEILADGGHPYDFGYHYNADDTDRRLSREEYDSWIAAGYNPLTDNYFDSEHFAGLY